jgi:hypothetical protein
MNDIKEKLLNDPFVFQKIQERAYFIAESNGFAPGRDADNWFAAETEVLAPILADGTTNGSANDTLETAIPTVKATTRKAAPKKAAAVTAEVSAAPVARAKRAPKKSV